MAMDSGLLSALASNRSMYRQFSSMLSACMLSACRRILAKCAAASDAGALMEFCFAVGSVENFCGIGAGLVGSFCNM